MVNKFMPEENSNKESKQETAKDEPEERELSEPEVTHEATTPTPSETETSSQKPEPFANPPAKKGRLKAFFGSKKGKIITVIAAVLLLIALVFIIPASRYAVAGLVIKKDITLQVSDAKTGKPVSGVQVILNEQTVKTNADGKATLKSVPVGNWTVMAKKNYYKNAQASTLVPILRGADMVTVLLEATGRQVPVNVTHKITGKPLANIEITAGDSAATTASNGEATLVLPADKSTVSATFKAAGYNDFTADVTVTDQPDDKNKFALTPSGKVYFLSKRTGKIDVMKSDLDGQNATTVVAGTGKESEGATVLLASRDWKYLALLARRDGDEAKLYLINTADDKLSVIDEGSGVGFELVGWHNENFIYKLSRSAKKQWEPQGQSVKSYNAAAKKHVTLDDTEGLGSGDFSWAHESYSNVYILENEVVFSKNWYNYHASPGLLAGKKDIVISVKPDGTNKKGLRDFDATASSSIDSRLYAPGEIYFRVQQPDKAYFYEYENGKFADAPTANDATFYDEQYPTYLVSPSGNYTFWFESRDGKNVNMVGNKHGENGKEVLVHADFWTYGWFTDDYLLLSRKGSELYILPREPAHDAKPLKITDYHKPVVQFFGYGYGYGGL